MPKSFGVSIKLTIIFIIVAVFCVLSISCLSYMKLESILNVSIEKGITANIVDIQVNDFKIFLIKLSIIIIFIALLISIAISGLIVKPIKHLKNAMKEVEGGNFTIQVDLEGNDELGQLVRSFNIMLNKQNLLMTRVQNTVLKVVACATDSNDSASKMEHLAKNHADSVEELSHVMNEMSKSITDVALSISDISENISKVNILSNEMHQSSKEVTTTIKETAATIDNVCTAIDDMNTSIEIIAKNAMNASSESEKTANLAKKSSEALNYTVLEMDNINNAMLKLVSEIRELGCEAIKIEDIVELIDDIADQTNILSLNAEIEATRAGEHGKGFAAVAGAIGRLAEKSSNATREVSKLIKAMQGQVNNAINTTNDGVLQVQNGVTLVKNIRGSLDGIFEAVENSSRLANEIAVATKEQSKSSKSITKDIHTVNEMGYKVLSECIKQADLINQVIDSIEEVNLLSESVAGAAEEQSASSEQVLASAEEMKDISDEVALSGENVSKSAEIVLSKSKELLDAMSKFII